jgi:hypothetical protein
LELAILHRFNYKAAGAVSLAAHLRQLLNMAIKYVVSRPVGPLPVFMDDLTSGTAISSSSRGKAKS